MLNEELLVGCHIRRATQQEAVSALKNLHTVLQQVARLRGMNEMKSRLKGRKF